MSDDRTVIIDYTNYAGERRERAIQPLSIYYGTSEWHKEAQWLLVAIDMERGVSRTFAVKSIHSFKAKEDRRS